jgi:hypothetical protein
MPSPRRKTVYRRPEPFKPPAPDPVDFEPRVRPTVAIINPAARLGRPGLAVGDRVRIGGSGLYAGDEALIERFGSGAVPMAAVRTVSGHTRLVRTIDLVPLD